MLRDAIATVSDIVEAKNITLLAEAAPMARFTADREAFLKICMTLLRNAVKFTPDDGRITVRTRHAAGSLNLYIEDTGIGIPTDALLRIGRPFEQVGNGALENGMRGSGLGLAIARSLAEMHGGSLRIRSTVGAGTIVLVHLPPPPRARAGLSPAHQARMEKAHATA